MKILFLTRLFSPHIGGVEKHVMGVARGLMAKGHSVTIMTERFDRTLPEKEDINGIAVYRIDAGKDRREKKIKIWKEMFRLRQLIREADVVHCHDVFFWYLPFRFLYPAKSVYTTFHGYESYPIKKSAIRMRRLSERLSWGNLCIGDFIPKWYGTKATIVSYGAVELPAKDSGQVRMTKDSGVFIGRLDEQTGAPMYAQAVELVKKKYPKFNLVFVGDGEDRKKLEKNFNVLGFQENPERYLPKYHFAFVSRYLSILEAFAAKRLVFAVYDNPVKEDYLMMAPYAKWIVIENTSDKLAEKIIYYLHHPVEEKEMVENAYKWVTRHDWNSLVKVYLYLWKRKN